MLPENPSARYERVMTLLQQAMDASRGEQVLAAHPVGYVLQGVVGFEEEVAGQMEVGDAAVLGLEIDDDELSARNLVLTVHESSLGAGHARAGTRASNQVTRSLTTSSRETSLKISCRAPG